MSGKSAYELSHDELLKKLVNAAARAGVSSSGLVIDPCGNDYFSDLRYLEGVLLARLEGKERPFRVSDKVLPANGKSAFGDRQSTYEPNHWPSQNYPFVGPVEVVKVTYLGKDKWEICFEGICADLNDGDRIWLNQGEHVRFKAADFVLAESMSAT